MEATPFQALVRELLALGRETEWVEFKHNKAVPEEIGEYISALSNSAALLGKPSAYILWGIEDGSRRIIGTTFRPYQKKVGNEELENWLSTQLDPRILVNIHEGTVEGSPLVIFEVQPAPNRPVRFKGVAYLRIGTYKKKASGPSRKGARAVANIRPKAF
jgi:ATP-dependent DNA helicase RecG